MDAIQFEPMSVGRIFDRAFVIYRNNFLRFIAIVAVIQVPVALLSALWISSMYAGFPAPSSRPAAAAGFERGYQTEPAAAAPEAEIPPDRTYSDSMAPVVMGFATLGVSLLAFIGNLLSQAALTKSVSETYLGHELTVGQAYRSVLPKLLTLVGASLLVGLIFGVGLIMCVVPGIIFGLWLALTTPAIVVENKRAIAGMSRSKALASGNLGKVFAVGLLAALITYIVMLPLGWLGSLLAMTLLSGNAMLAVFVRQFLTVAGQVLAIPIGASASILLYYDLRIRKEGFDLQMLAQSMTSNQG
jgi:hypothetical protein